MVGSINFALIYHIKGKSVFNVSVSAIKDYLSRSGERASRTFSPDRKNFRPGFLSIGRKRYLRFDPHPKEVMACSFPVEGVNNKITQNYFKTSPHTSIFR